MDTFFFFVPYRLIWDNWKKFMGEQKNPGDSTDFLAPQVKTPVGGWPIGSLGGTTAAWGLFFIRPALKTLYCLIQLLRRKNLPLKKKELRMG